MLLFSTIEDVVRAEVKRVDAPSLSSEVGKFQPILAHQATGTARAPRQE